MKQSTSNTFNEGLLMDMNPLASPQTCLSDNLNGTLITFNGNEFTLQSDNGNVKVASLPAGFIPVGIKEYGGIIYLALLNPKTKKCQIGSIPSPDFSVSTENVGVYPIPTFEVNNKYSFFELFNKNDFTISPGDKYLITEICKDLTPEANVITRPLAFTYNYKVVDSNNKLFDLITPNVNTGIKDYYKNTISGTIGLEVKLNDITNFECFGNTYYETTRKVRLALSWVNNLGNPSISKSAEGYNTDNVCVESVKVLFNKDIITLNDISTGELTIDTNLFTNTYNETNNTLSVTYDYAIVANDKTDFTLTIVPYNNYGDELTSLVKNLTFKFANEPLTYDNTISEFQYKVISTSTDYDTLELAFDFNYDPAENIVMYTSLYDVWSNCSSVFLIEDPNPYGKMILQADISKTDVLQHHITGNTDNIGGVLAANIGNNTNSDITLLGSGKIRLDNLIRNNNLYVFTIHKLVFNNGVYTETKYSKPLIVNDRYNQFYNNSLYPDFTKSSNLPYSTINTYNLKVDVTSENVFTTNPYLTEFDDTNMFTTVKDNIKYYYNLYNSTVEAPNYPNTIATKCTEHYNLTTNLKVKSEMSAKPAFGIVTNHINSQAYTLDKNKSSFVSSYSTIDDVIFSGTLIPNSFELDPPPVFTPPEVNIYNYFNILIPDQRKAVLQYTVPSGITVFSHYDQVSDPSIWSTIGVGNNRGGTYYTLDSYSLTNPENDDYIHVLYQNVDPVGEVLNEFNGNITTNDLHGYTGKSGFLTRINTTNVPINKIFTSTGAGLFSSPSQYEYFLMFNIASSNGNSGGLCIVPYSNREYMEKILKGIKVVKNIGNITWKKYFYNSVTPENINNNITVLKPVVSSLCDYTCVPTHYIYDINAGVFSPVSNKSSLIEKLNTTIGYLTSSSYNENYLTFNNINSSTIAGEVELTPINMSVTFSDENKTRILSGQNDLETLESSKLINTTRQLNDIYRYDYTLDWSFETKFKYNVANNIFLYDSNVGATSYWSGANSYNFNYPFILLATRVIDIP